MSSQPPDNRTCAACRGFGYTKGGPQGPWQQLDCPACNGTVSEEPKCGRCGGKGTEPTVGEYSRLTCGPLSPCSACSAEKDAVKDERRCACCGGAARRLLDSPDFATCDFCYDRCRAPGPIDPNWYHGTIAPSAPVKDERAECRAEYYADTSWGQRTRHICLNAMPCELHPRPVKDEGFDAWWEREGRRRWADSSQTVFAAEIIARAGWNARRSIPPMDIESIAREIAEDLRNHDLHDCASEDIAFCAAIPRIAAILRRSLTYEEKS